MEKSKLQSFINRFYLAGNCEAVILNENATGVACELIDMDQTVVGKLQWKTTPFMKGQLGINHTGALIKMLSAVGENINIDVQEAAGKNYAMKISEGSTKATFMLADTTVIPPGGISISYCNALITSQPAACGDSYCDNLLSDLFITLIFIINFVIELTNN